MPILNITFTDNEPNEFPIFHQYAGQFLPQPAFISLDINDGEVTADYSGEIGNAVPFDVWHKKVLRFSVEPCIRAAKIAEIIESHKDEFQAILDGASIEWDGNNNVGCFTKDAERIIEQLELSLQEESNQYAINIISDSSELYDYLAGNIYPENEDLESFADEIISNIDSEFYSLISCMSHSEGMLSYLAELWADDLYNGKQLPQFIAQYLVNQGICDDSAWTEELAAMADGTYNEEDF